VNGVHNARLAHRLEGPEGAPAVVLSGSLGTSFDLWAPQLEALHGRFRVLRYDHRGHGGSEVPPGPYSVPALATDVLALLDELGLERVSFCGLSLGGIVGMLLAAEHPDRIERLVLACTAPRFLDEATWRERAALVRREGPAAVADGTLTRWFTAPFHERRPDAVQRIREQLVATPREGYAGCCEALAAWDFNSRLGSIRVPTLVIAGSDDPSVTAAAAERLAGALGAPLTVVAAAAHLTNVEQPEAFNEALLAHLGPLVELRSGAGV
jgi:3-oxoadipate enol-lactonase